MNPNDPNVLLLEAVARQLDDDLLRDFVFIGGAVAGLLITDSAAPAIRATEDVDLIVQVATLADYHRVEARLCARGFSHDKSPAAPICRWRIGAVAVDVMPTLESILGFSNRWYPLAIITAQPLALPSGVMIRLITAPAFLATKLEAFAGRGNGDYLFSHDLGDFFAIIDGRESVIEECRRSSFELKVYLRDRITTLLATRAFIEAMPGHLSGDAASQARLPDLEEKLRALTRPDR